MNRKTLLALGAVVGLAVLGFLAFGVFGIQTKFTNTTVDEAGPVFASAGASGLPSDDVDEETVDDMNEFMTDNEMPAEVSVDEDMPSMPEPEIATLVSGSFVDRSHPAVGTINVLGDGSEQRFLRFESDFATDNGPDLNVYLSAGATADGDAGLFDDDFVDLGDMKGNQGAQNYEIPTDVDLSVYDTVVIWCVRFGVAFGAADIS